MPIGDPGNAEYTVLPRDVPFICPESVVIALAVKILRRKHRNGDVAKWLEVSGKRLVQPVQFVTVLVVADGTVIEAHRDFVRRLVMHGSAYTFS